MPVVDTTPLVVASPNAWVSASNSAPVRPASARTVARAGSTRMPFMGDKSIMNPPSHTLLPAALWPPLWTATTCCWSRAKLTAATTSPGSAQRTIPAGERSIIAFQIRRALS